MNFYQQKLKLSCLKLNLQPFMPKRTSINAIQKMEDLNDLKQIVVDKRSHKRQEAKKERRNRHYVKLLIKSQVKNIEL